MAYRKYSIITYAELNSVRNIMAVVGNGFDIQVMHDYNQPYNTRYESFYHFLKLRNFNGKNLILLEMEGMRNRGEKNWSDLENAIASLTSAPSCTQSIQTAIQEIQAEFSIFLNQVVTDDLLNRMGLDCMKHKLSVSSLAEFLHDLPNSDEFLKMRFPKPDATYNLFNFQFVNLNYTSLLDGYVFLDYQQFDPHPHTWADRNFMFKPNPRDHPGHRWDSNTGWSSYVLTDVVHPHGYQDIPRSLLFGIDSPTGPSSRRSYVDKLMKPYWAQNNVRYSGMCEETELFIIFGSSIGINDRWWWSQIAKALTPREATCPPNCLADRGASRCPACGSELIIYWWKNRDDDEPSEEGVKSIFLDAAGVIDPTERKLISGNIYVVTYTPETPRKWLKTKITSEKSVVES